MYVYTYIHTAYLKRLVKRACLCKQPTELERRDRVADPRGPLRSGGYDPWAKHTRLAAVKHSRRVTNLEGEETEKDY